MKRKLSSGRTNVDCAIDLHGLTQAQAHRALVDFLWRASESGATIVLVITGKGNLQNVVDHRAGERGVLRRAAPHWLRSAALRSIVLSIDEAARPHGGEGALYVRLRRRLPEQG
jgi:DNA-nicking Smr family endonuclease